VTQPSFRLGHVLGKFPETLEDLMVLARKQYVRVDSLCIDQNDDADKRMQIQKMGSIYSGANLTVIALSGETLVFQVSGLSNQGILR